MPSIQIFKKTDKGELCFGLSIDEMKCKCTYEACRAVIISTRLVDAYEKFRKKIGLSCTISSGYRCPQHNKDVGGSEKSRHQTGEAMDILFSKKIAEKFTLPEFIKIASESGFTFIKEYEGIKRIHADVR